ncbi:MAG TPA: ketopantoate reductase family protein [Phototrophicaceae bacterium]|jgi:2-dehydropantoate 2-reductase|nr:ketopantoate reductase family protein [Phototrophicaceae bacterium]
MRAIQKVIVIGLGAIGSIYAAKLKEHDPDCVRVLVDENRLERYQAHGIVLNGVRHDFNYVLPGQNQDKADLILIATKADALPDAVSALEGFVHDETIILSLLNGVTSEEKIAEQYGWDKVLHAYFIGHGSTRSGNAITFDGVGRIVFGEANTVTPTSRAEPVQRFFDQAGIAYEIPNDILFSMWCKFVINVGINQASAILRASYGVFQRSEKAHAIALELMEETVLIAEKVGISHVDAILPWCENFIHNMPPDFKSSMLQDIEAGKKTEVDMFGGAVCALGHKYGIPTPHNETFLKLIRALEEIDS